MTDGEKLEAAIEGLKQIYWNLIEGDHRVVDKVVNILENLGEEKPE